MKTKRILSRIVCALLVFVMIATCAPITSFAADEAIVNNLYNTCIGVKVIFSEVEGAETYTIYRKTGDGEFEAIGNTPFDSYYDKTAENNTEYTYYVLADNAETPDDISSLTKSTVFVEAPDFTVSSTEIGPKVEITPIEGATSYIVKRHALDSSTYPELCVIDADSDDLSYIDSDVEDGDKYEYCVVAYIDSYYSTFNSVPHEVKLAPRMTDDNYTSIRYIANTDGAVKLSVTAVDGAESYTIYRKTENGGYKPLTVLSAGTTTYLDKDVENNVLYTYDVAVTGYRFSGDEKTIKYLDAPDYSLSNAGTYVLVTITPVEGATSYLVERYDDNGNIVFLCEVKDTKEPHFFDGNVEDGKTYKYLVIAVDGSYRSTFITKSIEAYLEPVVSLANLAPGIRILYKTKPDAESYTLFRWSEDTSWEAIDSMKAASYSYFVDTTVESGIVYHYAVAANAADKTSGCDPVGSSILYLESPELFISNNNNSVTIDFTESRGAKKYQIMRKTAGVSFKTIAYVSASEALTYVDTDVVEGETYTYSVRAIADGTYSYINEKSVDVAVFSFDDEFTFDLGDDIVIDLNDADATEVSATATDTTADAEAAPADTATGFDFAQIIDFVSNFINGIDVEEGSVLETIITVINTILGYVSKILSFVA